RGSLRGRTLPVTPSMQGRRRRDAARTCSDFRASAATPAVHVSVSWIGRHCSEATNAPSIAADPPSLAEADVDKLRPERGRSSGGAKDAACTQYLSTDTR